MTKWRQKTSTTPTTITTTTTRTPNITLTKFTSNFLLKNLQNISCKSLSYDKNISLEYYKQQQQQNLQHEQQQHHLSHQNQKYHHNHHQYHDYHFNHRHNKNYFLQQNQQKEQQQKKQQHEQQKKNIFIKEFSISFLFSYLLLKKLQLNSVLLKTLSTISSLLSLSTTTTTNVLTKKINDIAVILLGILKLLLIIFIIQLIPSMVSGAVTTNTTNTITNTTQLPLINSINTPRNLFEENDELETPATLAVLSGNSNLQQQKQQRNRNKNNNNGDNRKSSSSSSNLSSSQQSSSSSSSSTTLLSTIAPKLLVTKTNSIISDNDDDNSSNNGLDGVRGRGAVATTNDTIINSNISTPATTNIFNKSNNSNRSNSRQDRSNSDSVSGGGGGNNSGGNSGGNKNNGRKPSPMSLKKQCSMSEYQCSNGRCVSINKFCDLINDCGDGSDEPRFCTRCNRTYYGDIGLTYSLELHRPKQDRIPFICVLTISAGGGKHGDIVQVTLDSFTVGRFTSYIQDGCPDGSLSISEATRSPIGGMWCGSSWGPVLFYSETRALIFTVKLNRLARDQSGYNFDFRIRYKVLSKDSSVTRYGGVKIEDVAPWFSLYGGNSSTTLVNPGLSSSSNSGSNINGLGIGVYGSSYDSGGGIGGNSIGGNRPGAGSSGGQHQFYNTTHNIMSGPIGSSGQQYPFIDGGGSHQTNKDENYNIFTAYMNEKGTELHKAVDRADPSNREYRNYTEPIYYLGDLIQGTYCSRIYSNCDRKVCRLQSPNYPGIYPRNLTCYYAIKQLDVPHGKHALITIKQPKGNLIWIATPPTTTGQNKNFIGGSLGGISGSGLSSGSHHTGIDKDKKNEPKIKTWNECDFIQDYVTIYDGYTTRDPVLLKFCGGGQSVPASTSSGPEILVEFTTSPYGTFMGSSSQILPLYGFQLEVEVTFVDALSPTFLKNKKVCEFWIRGSSRGVLENPKHSLAPNTTCLYHLQGTGTFFRTYDHMNLQRQATQQEQRQSSLSSKPIQTPRFKVWISLLKFNYQPPFGKLDDQSAISLLAEPEDCSGMLRIWDGPLREIPTCQHIDCERDLPKGPVLKLGGSNFTNIMARYCKGSVPRTCDRANINETYARPCTVSESYVSTGDSITLELKNSDSTALRPLDFKLRYEFVDLHQDGIPMAGDHDCSRKFLSSFMDRKDPAIFRSIRNVFMFGRGGATNLKCVYRFEAQRGERVRIKIKRVNTGHRECSSRVDEDINRSYCYGNTSIRVEIFERPYPDAILLPRACLCNSSDLSHLPVEYTSTGRDLEVHFTAINMTSLEDPETVNFEGVFEFVKGPSTCKDGRRKYGPSGTIDMTFGDIECRTRPWVIEPSNGNKYLYVRVRAIFLKRVNPKLYQHVNASLVRTASYRCVTKSRVVLTSSEGLSIIACPLSEDHGSNEFVEMFSAGWGEPPLYGVVNRSRAISVEFLRPTNGDYYFTWMEMVPRPPLGLVEDCKYKCAEIDACVNASVWCDGVIHCPSGDDESFLQCSSVMKLPAELLATICIVLLLICFGLMIYTYRKLKRKLRGSSVLQTRLKSLSSMDTAVFDEKDVIC